MLLEGLQLGRYHLLKLLGRGGMSEVYLAEDPTINQQVAIKIIIPYSNPDKLKEAARLFHREMKAIAQLDHLYILPMYGYGEESVAGTKHTYMVMPFRKEGALANWLLERRKRDSNFFSSREVAHFLHQAADALQYAHDHQIIHLDVKPSNFLLRSNNESSGLPDLLLADFGIAKFTTGPSSITVRGTPPYMSPEQWKGHPESATDQYALAITAYELLTGRTPFQGSPGEVMQQHFNDLPKPPSSLNQHIPTDVDAVILKALEKKPEDRFASIFKFADAFQQALVSYADIHVILSISEADALSGINLPLSLPNGRQITVSVPANAQNGQVIRFDGLGEPAHYGSISGALIVTIAIKANSESDLMIQDRLQGISKDIASLQAKANSIDQIITGQLQGLSSSLVSLESETKTNDQVITKQLKSLSKDMGTLQSDAKTSDQATNKQLQALSKDVGFLESDAKTRDQAIIKHLQSLSGSLATLQSNIVSSNQTITNQLQSLSSSIAILQPNINSSNPVLLEELRGLSSNLTALQSNLKFSDQTITNQLKVFSNAIAGLRSNPPSDQAITKQLKDLSDAIGALQAAVPNEKKITDQLEDISTSIASLQPNSNGQTINRNWLSKSLAVLIVVLVVVVVGSTIGLFFFINQIVTANTMAIVVAANPNPYPNYAGTLALYNPLDGSNNKYNWEGYTDSSFGGACQFVDGAYHASQSKPHRFFECLTSATDFNNFAYEVQMKFIKGDCGGIIFRSNSAEIKFYLFEICSDGSYQFLSYIDASVGKDTTLIPSHSTSAINSGLNQFNVIAVVANGSTMDLYVNHQKIDSVNDSTYSQGQIGVFADDFSNPTEVVFSNAKVWQF